LDFQNSPLHRIPFSRAVLLCPFSRAVRAAMNHYEILQIGHLAGDAEIRAAYLQRALELHPDKPSGSKTEFQKLVAAFEVLSDAGRRLEYNRLIWKSHSGPTSQSSASECHPPCGKTSSKLPRCGLRVTKPSCFFDTSGPQASRRYWRYRGMQRRRDVCQAA